jgi:hypothetical protein
VQREDSKVTEEWAAPIGHFLVIFLTDKQRPRESMEEVKSFRCIGERKRFKERPSSLLLYQGERNFIGRWMPIETSKGDQEELLNDSSVFTRALVVRQWLPVIMDARGKGRLESYKHGRFMGDSYALGER